MYLTLNMDILLWEWNLDVILVQRVIYTFQHIAYYVRLFRCVSPYEQIEVHAGVTHLRYHTLHLFALIHPLVVHAV